MDVSKDTIGTNADDTNQIDPLTEDNVNLILCAYNKGNTDELFMESYCAHNASDKMLGFLADYWKLKVFVVAKNGERRVLSFFIKAVSRTNEAKAEMVKELKLYETELTFYTTIKDNFKVAGLKPWSANLITTLDNAMVFEDLNVMKYKMRNKFLRFDKSHTLQALQTLARYHAAAIIFEEFKSKELNRRYTVNEAFGEYLKIGGYKENDTWYVQCMNGAMEAIQSYSKYSQCKNIKQIEKRWEKVWLTALRLNNCSEERNVIGHRDLWNNNLLFHYREVSQDHYEPDDCLLVDFQAIQCVPPAGDVMVLLHCNLDPKFREQNMDVFLDFYYQSLKDNLDKYFMSIDDVFPKDAFLASAERQRQWGLVVCACLIPQFWIDDDMTTRIFSNTEKFDEILSKDKGRFIREMMKDNSDYREKVLEIFDEIVDRYCLN